MDHCSCHELLMADRMLAIALCPSSNPRSWMCYQHMLLIPCFAPCGSLPKCGEWPGHHIGIGCSRVLAAECAVIGSQLKASSCCWLMPSCFCED
ncbi:hypothetical protein Nepgr_005347 [Nepenthes gracilis]|uniref:Uncharacterized protein n=1 Tax=Nepenthes gracilis TaxID=150966 RepID=A0AAD3XGC1_NEPGR|nr:hypothetical protein Nepgr_005347 [Nepenthes gracilis]